MDEQGYWVSTDREIDLEYILELVEVIKAVLKNPWPTRAYLKTLDVEDIKRLCSKYDKLSIYFYCFYDHAANNECCKYSTFFDSETEAVETMDLVCKDRTMSVIAKTAWWFCIFMMRYDSNFALIKFNPKIVCKALFPNRNIDKMIDIPSYADGISDINFKMPGYIENIRLFNQFLDDSEQQREFYQILKCMIERFDELRKEIPSFDKQIKQHEKHIELKTTKQLSRVLSKDDSKKRFIFKPGGILIDNVDCGIRNENSRIVLKTLVGNFGKPVKFVKLLPLEQKIAKMAQQPLRDAKTDINRKLKTFGLHVRNIRGTGYILENI